MFDPITLRITADYPMPEQLLQALETLYVNGLPLVRVYNVSDWDFHTIPDSKEIVVSAEPLRNQDAVCREPGEIGDHRGLMLIQCYHKRGWTDPKNKNIFHWWRLPEDELPPYRIDESLKSLDDPSRVYWEEIHLLSSAFDFDSSEGHLGILWVLASILNKPLTLRTYTLTRKVDGQPLGFVSIISDSHGMPLLVLGSTAYPVQYEEDRFWEIVSWPK